MFISVTLTAGFYRFLSLETRRHTCEAFTCSAEQSGSSARVPDNRNPRSKCCFRCCWTAAEEQHDTADERLSLIINNSVHIVTVNYWPHQQFVVTFNSHSPSPQHQHGYLKFHCDSAPVTSLPSFTETPSLICCLQREVASFTLLLFPHFESQGLKCFHAEQKKNTQVKVQTHEPTLYQI